MNPRTGRISYRGLLAAAIGFVFVWFAIHSEAFDENVPPFLILLIMFMAGAVMIFSGLASLRFVWKRAALVGSATPVSAEICVLMDDDYDRHTETIHVRIGGTCQALGADRSGAVANFTDGKVRTGQVWLDNNGRVHAVSVENKHMNTLIWGKIIPVENFGKMK